MMHEAAILDCGLGDKEVPLSFPTEITTSEEDTQEIPLPCSNGTHQHVTERPAGGFVVCGV